MIKLAVDFGKDGDISAGRGLLFQRFCLVPRDTIFCEYLL